jgi:pimeloyl-ACP methyl ester carboxylesterase
LRLRTNPPACRQTRSRSRGVQQNRSTSRTRKVTGRCNNIKQPITNQLTQFSHQRLRTAPTFTLRDQLELFRDVHQTMGFEVFQRFVAAFSFTGEFYDEHRDRLLGPTGAWGDLSGKANAHARLVEACLSHDTRDRLDRIVCPAFVLHAGIDPVTSPRTTMPLQQGIPGCQGELWPELSHVIAGKDLKMRFDGVLKKFLESCPA